MEQLLKYELLEVLCDTHFHLIYLGRRRSDQKAIVFKTIRDEHASIKEKIRLRHEYDLLCEQQCASVIEAYEFIEVGKPGLILDYYEGKPLKEFINNQRLNLEELLKVAIHLIKAIGRVHSKAVIHKDINPTNILVDEKTLELKLIDFEAATRLAQEYKDILNTDGIEGSLSYISPELTGRLNRPIDYRTDYYSLGVTLYELFTGSLPFAVKEPLEMIYDHLARTPERLEVVNPAIPEGLSNLVLKLLEKDPDNRYKSAVGITADLEHCYNQLARYGTVQSFVLGQKDRYEHLCLSTKLYGREQEFSRLVEAFKRVGEGACELVLVSGPSGVGKTSLIKELYKEIAPKHGVFLSAKFDQYLKAVPYYPFIEIMKKAIDQLLTNNPAQFGTIRLRLLNRLGKKASLLTAILPSLELIIGKQRAIDESYAKTNAQQIPFLFGQFFETLATREQPLVLFIDDWQWSDSASQHLLQYLIQSNTLKYCLIIASVRANEILPHHLFYPVLDYLKTQTRVREIQLCPLKLEPIIQLTKDCFGLTTKEARPLAELVYEKTQGTPFFINQFLTYLYRNKHISFSSQLKTWVWDIARIKQEALTINVADYLLAEINNLPKTIKSILKKAACIGFEFDLGLLLSVAELKPNEIQKALTQASNKQLLIADKEISFLVELASQSTVNQSELRCKFSHDKIHNAFYVLNSEEEKLKLHLKIGEILEKRLIGADDVNLLKVVNHFNQARALLTDPKIKLKWAAMNLRAGEFTQKSYEYKLAVGYFLTGIDYLETSVWISEPLLAFNLHYQLAYNHFLNGNLTQAEAVIALLFTQVLTADKLVKLNELSSLLALNQADYNNAITSGLNALQLLGEPLPKKVPTFRLIKELLKVKLLLRKKTKSALATLSEITDSLILNQLNALELITTPALLINPKLLALVHLKIIELTLKHGNSVFVGGSYIIYGMLLLGTGAIINRKTEDKAYAFGRLGLALLDQFDNKNFQSQFYIFYACFLHARRNPFKTCHDYLEKTYRFAYETGRLSEMVVAAHQMVTVSLLSGDYLNEVCAKADNALAIADKTKNSDEYVCMNFIKNCLLSITKEQQPDWGFDGKGEKEILDEVVRSQKNRANYIYLLFKLYYLFIFEEHSQVNRIGDALALLHKKKWVAGMYLWVFYYFIYPLCLAANYDTACAKERRLILKKIKLFLSTLEANAESNPQNYENKYFLLKAEYFRITHQESRSISYYQQSIKAAKKSGFIQEEAFAHELLGKFYLKLDDKDAAKTHLRMAYELYSNWGAISKLLHMETLYPYLKDYSEDKKDLSSARINHQSLDFGSFIKASQAIASEIEVNPLSTTLLKILVENAGAERGLIICLENEDWVVKIESFKGNETVVLTNESIKNRHDLPLNLLTYVTKTKQSLVLGDAQSSEFALNDPYLIENTIKSICIMPIQHKKKISNLLYLENNLAENVFNESKINMLCVLAKQAAISLENATLYHTATHDPLTGLANRSLLCQTFEYCAARALRDNTYIAIIFLDLDYFKAINDTLGHEVGDNLLIYFAEQIKKSLRKDSLGVRLGGDEFVIMIDGLKELDEVDAVVNRLYTSFLKPIKIAGHALTISTSMGISLYPSDATDIQSLLKLADRGLYKAKELGRNNYQFYTSHLMKALHVTRLKLSELKDALTRNQFILHYQPIVNVQTNRIQSLEAFVRWEHPTQGCLSAREFIPMAEKNGLITAIDHWVIESVCRQIKTWESQHLELIPIVINISGIFFKNHSVSQLMKTLLGKYEVDPSRVEVEITENIFIEPSMSILTEIAALKTMGIKVTLEDFGIGFSYLSYLKNFLPDKLKLDQLVVKNMCNNSRDKKTINGIIALAHHLELEVVAQGIENTQQLAVLKENLVYSLQGYYISRPQNTEDCTLLLKKGKV